MKRATTLLAFAVMLLSASILQAQTVFINEIHYDDDGADEGEGIEVAGPAGTDLTGWTIVLYNGAASSRAPYETIPLSGTISDQQNGYGTLFFYQDGIQNGAPDGLALVNAANATVQFLSYEGSFLANGGPADGMLSTDIGVVETDNPPLGQSLQLTGSGNVYTDFTWSAPQDTTYGLINLNQMFVAPSITNARISVIVDSLVANCDGSYTAFFGYLSANTETISIPVGADNRFSPAPVDRGQTTDFLPGRHRKVFAVDFDGSNLVWSLEGPDGQTRTATAGLNFPNITQATDCPSACDMQAAPSYAGGYVLNTNGTRAFVKVIAPAGATTFEFYNTSNLVVGEPEASSSDGDILLGYIRSGNTFSFETGSEPDSVFFPITTAGSGTSVSFYLRVTDTCGRTVDVDPAFSLSTGTETLPGFALAPAQPNPASSEATIGFSLEAASHVRLVVFDMLGREVARLVDEVRGEGEQSVRFEASQLPSGVYVYRLEADGRALTRTVTVAR